MERHAVWNARFVIHINCVTFHSKTRLAQTPTCRFPNSEYMQITLKKGLPFTSRNVLGHFKATWILVDQTSFLALDLKSLTLIYTRFTRDSLPKMYFCNHLSLTHTSFQTFMAFFLLSSINNIFWKISQGFVSVCVCVVGCCSCPYNGS